MIDRRTLLLAVGATMTAGNSRAQSPDPHTIPLWPGGPPGGGGPQGPIEIDERGAIRNIAIPSLEVFTPDRPNGGSVLIAAGGGYRRIEVEREARPAARWLAQRGITAFVLAYRLPVEGWAAGALAPLQDAQRALRVIRAGTAEDGRDPNRVGVLGFSAGGHLVGLAATRSAFRSYDTLDATDSQSARPAETALIYPIITLEPPYRTATRRVLIGRRPDPGEAAEWSVQTHVRAHCPPVFLVQAADDPISDPQNSEIMASACRQAGVSVETHLLPSGGHGFGMGQPGTPTAAWPGWYEAWLRANGAFG